jgi:tetratricopeptide (TPR) repeat protein
MSKEPEKNTLNSKIIKPIIVFVLPFIATRVVDEFLFTIPMWIQVCVLLTCGFFTVYNFLLLPFETRRLAKIKQSIDNLEFEKAKDELNGKSLYKGKRSQFKEMLLLHSIHTATGNLVEAYGASEKIFKLASNDSDYQIALARRAITMYEAGNQELFREIIKKIDSSIKNDKGEALLAESLKAYAYKKFWSARRSQKTITDGFGYLWRRPGSDTAYINLAVYEDLDGNTIEALHVLKKAKAALEKSNNKLFVSSLYHTLSPCC